MEKRKQERRARKRFDCAGSPALIASTLMTAVVVQERARKAAEQAQLDKRAAFKAKQNAQWAGEKKA